MGPRESLGSDGHLVRIGKDSGIDQMSWSNSKAKGDTKALPDKIMVHF